MPIKSYIAYPVTDSKSVLQSELLDIDECTHVQAADNEDIILLVTETENEDQERCLENKLREIESLQCLAMTFGHMDQ